MNIAINRRTKNFHRFLELQLNIGICIKALQNEVVSVTL